MAALENRYTSNVNMDKLHNLGSTECTFRYKLNKICTGPDAKIYKILMNGIKEDLCKWRDIPCSWIRRFNIVNRSIFPKLIHRFNTIPVNPSKDFTDIDRLIIKCIWKTKDLNSLKILKNNKMGRITLFNVKGYFIAIVIKLCDIDGGTNI